MTAIAPINLFVVVLLATEVCQGPQDESAESIEKHTMARHYSRQRDLRDRLQHSLFVQCAAIVFGLLCEELSEEAGKEQSLSGLLVLVGP